MGSSKCCVPGLIPAHGAPLHFAFRPRSTGRSPTCWGIPRLIGYFHPVVRVSIHAAAAISILFLSACADKPVVAAVDTLCVSTSRPPITEAQRAAFKADQALWEPLVDWLASFLKVRDGACLKSVSGA